MGPIKNSLRLLQSKQFISREVLYTVVHPDSCTIVLAALDDPDLQASHVTYWDDVYGFKMTCMKSEVIKEASVEIVKAEKIISDQVVVKVQFYLSVYFYVFSHVRGSNKRKEERGKKDKEQED